MAAEVGSAFVSIIPSLKGFSAKLRAELAGELRTIDPVVGAAGTRAGQTFGSSMHNALSGALTRIGALLKTTLIIGTTAAVAGLGALTAFGLKSAASMEQTSIGLEALVGNAEDAKKFLGELQDFAAKTPFEFAGVADASRRILAFGTSVGIAREQVIPTLTTIGDLVSVLGGSQENINSVVRALGQMASKGKLSQEEILQLAEALPGFNANAAIASSLGLSVADTLDLITAGGVDATTGINALLKGMAAFPGAAGAMAKQAETLTGVFSTFKDTIAIALTNAFQPVIPEIKASLSSLTPILGDTIGQLAPKLGELLSAMLPLVGILTQTATPILLPVLTALGDILNQITSGVDLVGLGQALGDIVAQFAPLAPLLAQVAGEFVQALIPAIKEIAPQLPELVRALADLLIALVPLIPPLADLGVFMAKLNPANIFLLTAAVSQFTDIITLLRGIDFGAVFSSIGNAISGAASAVGNFFQQLPGRVGAFLAGLPNQLADLAKEAFNQFAFAVGFGIGTIIKFFLDLPETISGLVSSLWARVRDLFTSGVEQTKNNTISGFNRFVDFVRSLPGQVIGALAALPGQLASFGANLVSQMFGIGRDIVWGAINGIRSMIGGLISVLKDGFANAVAGVKRGLGIGSPSKVAADEIGEPLAEGAGVGFERGIKKLAAEASGATFGALAAATARTAAPAARPVVNVQSDDPLINLVIGHLREAVRTTYGGDVEFALGTAG